MRVLPLQQCFALAFPKVTYTYPIILLIVASAPTDGFLQTLFISYFTCVVFGVITKSYAATHAIDEAKNLFDCVRLS